MLYDEVFPTSPLILNPFSDALTVPQALRPEPYGDGPTGTRAGAGGGSPELVRQRQAPALVRRPAGLRCDDAVGVPDRVKVDEHSFTSSPVLPINASGLPRDSFDQHGGGSQRSAYLPPSTIYGFNGTFPGPRSTPSTANRCSCGSSTTWARTKRAGSSGLRCPGLFVPDASAQRAHRTGERRQPPLLDVARPVQRGVRSRRVGRQSVFELAGG